MMVECINNDKMLDVLTKGKIYKVVSNMELRGKKYYFVENDHGIRCAFYVERFKEVQDYKVDLL